MKIATLGLILLLTFSPSIVFSQTIRVVNGTKGVQRVGQGDIDIRIIGYFFDNHLKYVEKINVNYSGTIHGKKADVNYTISCQEDGSVMWANPGFSEIRSCPGKIVLVGKIVMQEDINAATELALQDLIISSENNILSSWLVSHDLSLGSSHLNNIKNFPKKPQLRVANKEFLRDVPVALFAIKDWKLEYIP